MSEQPADDAYSRAAKAERAKMRAALKREEARLLRLLADAKERSAEIDERLAVAHLSAEQAEA